MEPQRSGCDVVADDGCCRRRRRNHGLLAFVNNRSLDRNELQYEADEITDARCHAYTDAIVDLC